MDWSYNQVKAPIVSRTMWTPSKLSPRGPVYLAIADALARDLEEGRVRPSERLPTHRDLARTLGVNVVTITRAYAEAARRGLVEGQVGRGTFVRAIERPPLLQTRASAGGALVDLSQNQIALDPSFLELEELFGSLAERSSAMLLSGYQPSGLPEHRSCGAQWLARSGLDVDPGRVLVTSGGQHALAAVLAAFAKPGDTVLVEELTYSGVKSLAALFHLRLFPVEIDEHGIRPEALEDACRRGNPRLLYCMPNLQNPTGVVLSAERREKIAALAERYELLLLEDDASGFLLEDPPPPLAGLAPERSVFISSLSKSFSPALRIGYLAAAEPLLERLLSGLSALTWMTPPLMAEIAARVISDGKLAAIAAAKRDEIRERRLLFARQLGGLSTASDPASSCVWAELPEPWRAEEFVAEAERRGVRISGAETFAVSRASAPHAVRLCIGTPDERSVVAQALGRIARILEGLPAPSRALV